MLLTAAELVRLVSTVVIIITGILQRDALSITAFVLIICTGAMCGALAWRERKISSREALDTFNYLQKQSLNYCS